MIKILNTSKYFFTIVYTLFDYIVQLYGTNSCEIVDRIEEDDMNYYLIIDVRMLKITPINYIIYNFEQLDAIEINEQLWYNFNNAKMILDYSQLNIDFFQSHNIDATFLPLCWNRYMKINKNININKRQNTFMFIGHLNERRRDMLKPIHTICKTHDYNMFISNECWDNEYNHMLSITKIGLNIHCYNGKTILEVHRIIPYILNKIWVISERSQDKWYDDLFDDLVTWFDDDNTLACQFTNVLNMSDIDRETEVKLRQRKLIEKCSYNKDMIEKLNLNSFIT
jgi:hypothetical protein